MTAHKSKKRIVILGGGFAGVYTYLELHKQFHKTHEIEVTMVSESDQFVFVPMVPEVAVGGLLPSSVTRSIRNLPWCCMHQFVHGRATAVDLDKQIVQVEYHKQSSTSLPEAEPHHHHMTLSYDYLVLAMGSETNFFGVPGAREHTLPMKTLNDARRFKNHVIERFEEAMRLEDVDAIRDELRFVIVGGGATGVELMGELSDLIEKELTRTFPELKGYASVLLVEGSDRLLRVADAWFGKRIHRALDSSAYTYFLFESRVKEVTEDGVYIGEDREFIRAKSVIWSGGVRARGIAVSGDRSVDFDERTQRIKVTHHLHLDRYTNVFAAGDQAWAEDAEKGEPYPMRAQFATRQGATIAQNIAHDMHGEPLEHFSFDEQGFIVSLGSRGAFAEIFGFKLSGFIAKILYKAAYVAKTPGWRSKTRMALDWGLNLFLPRDISKL